jgi:predicted ATP-grasp superfamily ATP-dependent carboligase
VARVIVTSAQERFALAACRSLAAAGHEVTAVADQTPAPAHWSRCCSARHVLPDAKADADAFVAGLVAIVRRTEHATVLAGHDAALLAISHRRGQLEPYVRLGLPPQSVVDDATDKIALDAASREAGLGAPASIVCHTAEDGRRAARELGLPLIVKPRRTAFEQGGAVRQRASGLVADAGRLEALATGFGTPFLLQRLQAGEVHSAAGVVTPEGIRSFSLARYVRTWPPRAGNVAYAETLTPPDDLRERVERLLRRLEWTGLFELELILAPTGTYHAIDLNPRLYGSLAHAARAGAPHAAVFVDWVLGADPPAVTARAGVGYRWEDADLRHALWSLRNEGARAALAILRPRRNVAHAHLRRDDPAPMVARALLLARQRSGR